MVRDFRQRRVPIDGVGFQMHIASLHADVQSISANIKRFAALGVQVHITEMDVALPIDADGNPRPEDLQRQADIYREIATACVSALAEEIPQSEKGWPRDVASRGSLVVGRGVPCYPAKTTNRERPTTSDQGAMTPYNVVNPWPHRIQFATNPSPPAGGHS